jgi:hypothetical protein
MSNSIGFLNSSGHSWHYINNMWIILKQILSYSSYHCILAISLSLQIHSVCPIVWCFWHLCILCLAWVDLSYTIPMSRWIQKTYGIWHLPKYKSFCEETQSLSDIHAKIANVMNQASEEQQKAAWLMFHLYKQTFARHLRHKVFELA